jgi:DNA ligase N terminus
MSFSFPSQYHTPPSHFLALSPYPMSFYFRHLYELFDTINGSGTKSPGKISVVIHTWFDKYDVDIPRPMVFSSFLFPECRTDRVLRVHKSDFERIIQSAYGLGQTCINELQCWRNTDGPDFTSAVQCVLSAANSGPRSRDLVMVGEIEQILNRIASRSLFFLSSLKEEARQTNSKPANRSNELVVPLHY